MATGETIESRIVGALPLLRQICRDIGLAEVVDDLTTWDPDRCRLSPGQRIEALVLDVLCRRSPLYRVAKAYRETATDLVFGQAVRAEDLTDDALARALDKVARARGAKVYSAVALRACLVERVQTRTVHADTTSKSLYGVYPDPPEGGLRPARGYSKDNHPELKQIVLAMLTNHEGLPLWAETEDGNANDRKLHGERIVAEFCAALAPERLAEMIYVGDSALVTGPNLERMAAAGLRFISRLPESFAVARTVKDAAWEADQWEELGVLAAQERPTSARYRASEHQAQIDGRTYRLVVVHSDHLDTRKQKLFDRDLRQERAALQKEADHLAQQRFACEADAETAAGALLLCHEQALHRLQLDVVPEVRPVRRSRPGRPRRDEPTPTYRQFRVTARVLPPTAQRLDAERARRATFVLITSLIDRDAHPARALLEEYRDQYAVESRFRMLKDPLFIDAIFLHTPRRIEALSYVLVMACLVYSIFERRVRQALAQRGQRIEIPGNRFSAAPTARSLLLMLEGLCVARLDPRRPWQLAAPQSLRAYLDRLLRLIGYDLSLYYGPGWATPPP